MKETTDVLVVALIVSIAALISFSGGYELGKGESNTPKISEIQQDIFLKINKNTTNQEIIDMINDKCENPNLFVESCKQDLMKTFVTSTRGN